MTPMLLRNHLLAILICLAGPSALGGEIPPMSDEEIPFSSATNW